MNRSRRCCVKCASIILFDLEAIEHFKRLLITHKSCAVWLNPVEDVIFCERKCFEVGSKATFEMRLFWIAHNNKKCFGYGILVVYVLRAADNHT